MTTDSKTENLAQLRVPFPEKLVSKLPKGSKEQNTCPYSEKRSCSICGGFHHPKIIHLDYVGHAALTHRLLDVDPLWYWEPMAFTPEGLPLFDPTGGLWIRLTICGHTRIGYGHAASKGEGKADPGAREKEVIGDALRNAAMRFGAALDLWFKGDLHASDDQEPEAQPEPVDTTAAGARANELLAEFEAAKTPGEIEAVNKTLKAEWDNLRHINGLVERVTKTRAAAVKRVGKAP